MVYAEMPAQPEMFSEYLHGGYSHPCPQASGEHGQACVRPTSLLALLQDGLSRSETFKIEISGRSAFCHGDDCFVVKRNKHINHCTSSNNLLDRSSRFFFRLWRCLDGDSRVTIPIRPGCTPVLTLSSLISVLGQGERVSLAALAVNHLQRSRRPLRIAIDFSIWLFQIQASKGGANPELRTLLFRLIRLTTMPINPLFIFDGPKRPHYKRGKYVAGNGWAGGQLLRQARKLLDAFRFPHHTAPGEAEAECSRLQVAGVVDTVMTEDVDAIMFGSTNTIMNFSKENAGTTSAATHVSLFRTRDDEFGGKANITMDRGGMVLFALLSGGDYLPSGLAKCGSKLAAEIVNAGFGVELLDIFTGPPKHINIRLQTWRERLETELHENTSRYFKNRHRAIVIPDDFPNKQVVADYITPIVSSNADIDNLRKALTWEQSIDVYALHDITHTDLGWERSSGAVKLTRVLAGPLLTRRLLHGLPLYAVFDSDESTNNPIICNEKEGENDGPKEVRLEFVPLKVVGLEIDPQSATLLEVDSDAEIEEGANDSGLPKGQQRIKRSYDPKLKERIWVPEVVAQLGMSAEIDSWRKKQTEKKQVAEAKHVAKKTRARKKGEPKLLDPSMRQGELLRYGRIVKSSTELSARPISTVARNHPKDGGEPSPPTKHASKDGAAVSPKPALCRSPRKAAGATVDLTPSDIEALTHLASDEGMLDLRH